MKNSQKVFITTLILIILALLVRGISALPAGCADQEEGTPVITSLSAYSGSVGDVIEIKGCNFLGFEGDKVLTIENDKGVTAPLFAQPRDNNSKTMSVKLISPVCQQNNSYSGLPCTSWLTLTPGNYKIYTTPWGKKSNEVGLTIN